MSDKNAPGWYQRLSHAGKDRIDQALHFLAGFGLAFVGTAALAWGWFHHREFFKQAPIERIYDTERDLRFGGIGAAVGQFARDIGIGLVFYLLSCSAAHAAPYTLKFQNPSPTQAYTQLRTPWGIVAAPCAPGATCSVVIDAPIGQQTITAEATSDGTLWSAKSNALSARIFPLPADCLALPACRFDPDGNGQVTVGDFGAFLSAMGSSW